MANGILMEKEAVHAHTVTHAHVKAAITHKSVFLQPTTAQHQHPPNTVFLNVYDVLTPSDSKTIPRLNNVLVHCGMGIFHTGIQVWGREFAFGGHAEPDTGIFEVPPRECPAVRYRMTLKLGQTAVSERTFDHVINTLGMSEYLGYRYSLITRNCNTFSSHLARLLGVDSKFPAWVNRLACLALNVRCLLPEPLLQPLYESIPGGPLLKEPQEPPPVATL